MGTRRKRIKRRTKKGGVLFLKSHDIMSEIRKFSKGVITVVKSGNSGVTFKLTVQNEFETKDIPRGIVKDPIRTSISILVKLVSIGERQFIGKRIRDAVMVEEFENEVFNHHEICERSLKLFDCSIAPTLLYADIYKSAELKKQLPNIGVYVPEGSGEFGVIFMELILSPYGNNAFPLAHYHSYPYTKEWALQEFPKARRLLIMLAQLGFLHNDFHLGNILCSPPALFLIDFERTKKIPSEKVEILERFLHENDYLNIIPLLYGNLGKIMDSEKETEFSLIYQWLRQPQIDSFESGLDQSIMVAPEAELTRPIQITKEEHAHCVTPTKDFYFQTKKAVDEKERANQAAEAAKYAY